MTYLSKIQSIRESVGGVYTKPDIARLEAFNKELQESEIALNYLTLTRGLSKETIEHFRLGYDSVKNAIVIPVFKKGELINLRYRMLEPGEGSKYTQEKGCEVWIYNEDGINEGLKKGNVLIVEGEFDLMSAWQQGMRAVISPASGKDSYGVWLEMLDPIPRVYIALDNDKPGKTAALKLAERVGIDKCQEIIYPEGFKDANEFFLKNTIDVFKGLIKEARPFYKYQFQGVKEVIDSIRTHKDNVVKIDLLPFVEFEEDWLAILSGDSNVGKTTMALNIANSLIDKGIPTLVMPFERGIKTVGKRFIQARYQIRQTDFDFVPDSRWDEIIKDAIELPLYFSMPSRDEITETISKAKRIFNTKVVIVDHLNYLVRKSDQNENVETSRTLQEFKSLAQEHGIIFIIVHHINKPQGVGEKPKKPKKEDLKGSSSIYQDPEAVIMLSSPEKGKIEVDIVKNKGAMGSKIFDFDAETGVIFTDGKKPKALINKEPVQKSWDETVEDEWQAITGGDTED